MHGTKIDNYGLQKSLDSQFLGFTHRDYQTGNLTYRNAVAFVLIVSGMELIGYMLVWNNDVAGVFLTLEQLAEGQLVCGVCRGIDWQGHAAVSEL